jgi:hypothetical protein
VDSFENSRPKQTSQFKTQGKLAPRDKCLVFSGTRDKTGDAWAAITLLPSDNKI